MASKTVVMTNPTGLHTRPGGVFVAKAKEFESDVFVVKIIINWNQKWF